MDKSSQSATNGRASRSTPAFVMDGAGIVVQWSSAAEAIFGWQSSEALGRKLSELIIPENDRAAHEAGLKHFMAAGGRARLLERKLNLTLQHRDGHELPLTLTIGSEDSAGARVFPTRIESD